ncbi:hypothetical protein [Gordonia neofelifaecis]|uniref:Uncharacterized protein n=1 Tax=Gordonia neofelifaecis NRRL B-59395 TaxID=644548 RepID=F1YE69_9ACTN|nr:hypothetical protein [Gordonia neofelifaecis]EGD57159.1 hypothetical protein SCNU_02255 [Gordonia neofelifaecis NRRL B-59395]
MAASDNLSEHQQVPLTAGERRVLRREAADRDVTPGIFSRALVLDGLERLDEPDLDARIERERDDSAARSRASATTAARRRWGKVGK